MPTRPSTRLLAGAVLALALAVAPAAAVSALPSPDRPAQTLSHEQILAALNAQRQANGIPPVTESPPWSGRCSAHISYEALNSYMGHGEEAGKPGYSDEGARGGVWSSQSVNSSWVHGNPWENAPWHLHFMLNPYATQVGFAEEQGFNCMGAGDGDLPWSPRPVQDAFAFYGYSPTGGTVPYAQTAFEAPQTPGEFVGIPTGTKTGPNLMVWALSPDESLPDGTLGPPPLETLSSATLTGPHGPVEVRVMNGTNNPADTETFGIVIPVQPLEPNAAYTLTAIFESSQPMLVDGFAEGRTARSATFTKTFTTDGRWLVGIAGQRGPGSDPSDPASAPRPPARAPVLTGLALRSYGLAGLATRGLSLRLGVGVARARVSVSLLLGRRMVAQGTVTARRAGTVALTLRPGRAGRALISGRGRLRLTLRISAAAPGGKPQVVSQPLVLG
jgi:cysteine-rich secretory family protein